MVLMGDLGGLDGSSGPILVVLMGDLGGLDVPFW